MEIVFGWHLDGTTYPETTSGNSFAFNSAVCGPTKVLNLLETYFGLGGPTSSSAIRIARYLLAIESVDTSNEFFSASFAVDPWSTSQLLLNMRDELIAERWSKQALPAIPKSKVFAALEDAVITTSPSDRIHRIIAALKSPKSRPFNKITLVEPIGLLPNVWQLLLNKLKEIGVSFSTIDRRFTDPSTDLCYLQSAFLKHKQNISTLSGDRSLMIIEADNEIQAAEVAAGWLADLQNTEKLVLIKNDRFSMLDEACSRHGLPRIGRSSESQHRGILQILPLAFELSYTPFDPARCLEFLSISGGPIPRSVSKPLIDALRHQPGIDGPLWREAWNQIRHIKRAQLMTNQSVGEELDATLDNQLVDWKNWFAITTRRDSALTSSNVEMICRRVEDWARRRASVESESSLYHVAARHAAELAEIVNGFGDRVFSVHQLRSVIETVIAEGAGELSNGAEASSWTTVENPGQIWNSVDTVVWWNFASAQQIPNFKNNWSDSEIEHLHSAGITVERASKKTLRQAHSWKSPILNASKRLIFFKPTTSIGRPAVTHPLEDEMVGYFPGAQLACVTQQASTFFTESGLSIEEQPIATERHCTKLLPSKLRLWQIEPNLIAERSKESYTSLERLLGCPLSWTLEYQGRMRSGPLHTIAEEERLVGDFAHAAIAHLFTESTHWQPAAAKERILSIMDDLFPQIASSMLLPGNSVRLRKTRHIIADSTAHLISILNDANLTIQASEIGIDTTFGTASFGGNIDLLVKTTTGQPVVLDLKWSRYPNRYRQKLLDGNALQLATYGWLMSNQDGQESFAPGAFYLLRQSRLFASDSTVFPAHSVKADISLESTWSLATSEYEAVLEKLVAGSILATGVIDKSDGPKEQRMIEPPCKICNFAHFCGVEELK